MMLLGSCRSGALPQSDCVTWFGVGRCSSWWTDAEPLRPRTSSDGENRRNPVSVHHSCPKR